MGGKRKRSRQSRVDKRARTIGKEAEVALSKKRDAEKAQHKPDDKLFTLDTKKSSKVARVVGIEKERARERRALDAQKKMVLPKKKSDSKNVSAPSTTDSLGPRARARREAKARRNRLSGVRARGAAKPKRGKSTSDSFGTNNVAGKGGGTYDLWNDNVTPWGLNSDQSKEDAYLAKHGLANVKHGGHRGRAPEPKKRPKQSLRSTDYTVPAVQVAQGGLSYNPSTEDHEEALAVAVAHERARLEEEEMTMQRHFPGESMIDEEESDGKDDDDEEEEDDDDDQGFVGNAPVRCNRLTRQQKAKRKEAKAEQKRAAQRRSEKARSKKPIQQTVAEAKRAAAEREAELQRKRETRDALRKEQLSADNAPLKRGGKKIKEYGQGIVDEVPLSSELTGSMRTLTTTGSVALDRFRSLQRRNMMELGRSVKSKKGKYKTYTVNDEKKRTFFGEKRGGSV